MLQYENIPPTVVDSIVYQRGGSTTNADPKLGQFTITLAGKEKTVINLVMEDKPSISIDDPTVDANGVLTCYAPVGITETIKVCCIDPLKKPSLVFTGNGSSQSKYVYTLCSNNQPRQTSIPHTVQAQLKQYALTVTNSGPTGTYGNTDYGAFTFWYIDGNPDLEIDLRFADPADNFPESYYQQGIYHMLVPGSRGSVIGRLLNDIQFSSAVAAVNDTTKSLSLSFTYPAPGSVSCSISAPYTNGTASKVLKK